MTKHIPDGYHTLTLALIVKDARKAIAFYKKAFGAEEKLLIPTPEGKVMHAELAIGDSRFMLGEENPAFPDHLSAESLRGSPVSLNLYVPDAEAAFKKAVAAGAKGLQAPLDAFWGDKHAKVADPFGYTWGILTHVKDVSPDEMKRGALDFMTQFAHR
jgi:PhnB protein